MKNIFCIRRQYASLFFTTLITLSIGISANAQGSGNTGGRQREGTVTRSQPNRGSGNIERPTNQPRRDVAANNGRIGQDRRNNTIQRNNTATRPVENRGTINSRPRTNTVSRNPGTANRPAQVGQVNNRPRFGTVSRPAYRPVYGSNRPVYSAINPGWRYGYLPRRNAYYSYLPSTYLTINFGGFGYRYWNGVYYRPYNNLFTVIAPPPGIFINVLPVGYRTLYVRDYPYYYYNGTYYDKRDNNYYVVSPPVGAVVESLPAGYETATIDGETYYTIDGAQYKPVIKDNGEIWYEVIKAN